MSVMREVPLLIDAFSGNPVSCDRKWIWRRVELVNIVKSLLGLLTTNTPGEDG